MDQEQFNIGFIISDDSKESTWNIRISPRLQQIYTTLFYKFSNNYCKNPSHIEGAYSSAFSYILPKFPQYKGEILENRTIWKRKMFSQIQSYGKKKFLQPMRRINYTKKQKNFLTKIYIKEENPSKELKSLLSCILGRNIKSIQFWFQNTRARYGSSKKKKKIGTNSSVFKLKRKKEFSSEKNIKSHPKTSIYISGVKIITNSLIWEARTPFNETYFYLGKDTFILKMKNGKNLDRFTFAMTKESVESIFYKCQHCADPSSQKPITKIKRICCPRSETEYSKNRVVFDDGSCGNTKVQLMFRMTNSLKMREFSVDGVKWKHYNLENDKQVKIRRHVVLEFSVDSLMKLLGDTEFINHPCFGLISGSFSDKFFADTENFPR